MASGSSRELVEPIGVPLYRKRAVERSGHRSDGARTNILVADIYDVQTGTNFPLLFPLLWLISNCSRSLIRPYTLPQEFLSNTLWLKTL